MIPKKKKSLKKIWEPMPVYKTHDPGHMIGSIILKKTTILNLKNQLLKNKIEKKIEKKK